MKQVLLFILLLLNLNLIIQTLDSCTPLWPRIEFGKKFSDISDKEKIVIKFNTRSPCVKSYVTVIDQRSNLRKIYCQAARLNQSDKMNNYQTFIQRCSVSQINFQEKILYIAYGSNSTIGAGIPFDFRPIQTIIFDPNTERTLKLIILADWSQLGEKINTYVSLNASLDKINEIQSLDGMIINGDLAYDLDSNNGTNYQEFLAILSRICRYIPVYFNTGNHQHNSNDDLQLFYGTFEPFTKRQKLAVGLNMGPFYLVGFDPYQVLYKSSQTNLKTESIKSLNVFQTQSYLGLKQMIEKGKLTNKFIITTSHYPLICSNANKNCQKDKIYLKQYFDLMFDAGIQFYIGAHHHVYQRIYPYCQNGQINKLQSPYDLREKNCMVTVIQGIAGNSKSIIQSYDDLKQFTAAVSFNKTGFGLMKINQTNLKYYHYSTQNLLNIQDTFQMNFDGNNQYSKKQKQLYTLKND